MWEEQRGCQPPGQHDIIDHVAKNKRARNPFYFLLVPVGVAFVVTSFAFGMMAYQQSRPGALPLEGEVGVMPLLDRHGLTILGVEVALIAVFSCGAIATDEYWQRREAKQKEAQPASTSPGSAARPQPSAESAPTPEAEEQLAASPTADTRQSS